MNIGQLVNCTSPLNYDAVAMPLLKLSNDEAGFNYFGMVLHV